MKSLTSALLLLTTSASMAQVLPAFPSAAQAPKAIEISDFVKDKNFTGTRSDGITGKFNYRSDGKFDVIYPQAKEFGTWRTEDGNLCVDDPLNGKTCNQVRIVGGNLLYRRNK